MGITGLARWINAPTTGVEQLRRNIILNHQGVVRGKWQLSLGSYRSTMATVPGVHIPERALFTTTMGDNVFALLEDPAAPTRAEVPQEIREASPGHASAIPAPSHYRNTLVTVSPPGALEQLLSQLRARWVPVRQAGQLGSQASSQKAQLISQQLTIEGLVCAIGTDWLVRFGHVILAGGAVKGMLVEAEYLPLPVLHCDTIDGSSELLSNLLASVLPMVPDVKIVAVTVADSVWDEVLGGPEDEEGVEADTLNGDTDDDIYASPDDLPALRKGDWTGVNRDRRSAFSIVGALKQEGLL
ncbi:hypothetical protein WOLCODRAFT_131647 [Wolfiporia cocos MD-104 SS10]|uniref:Mediator of RNA polymerase II transcription subunit 20 n=1 Tax=Wolfiporia cocos (strain MD-104) TaxID=742152 RepID=A0A2H3JW96_WOLCO|nr:hypothetical protein WOLCODRAFT_131647 [Wolfiporia cocos MD-104 SS10]